ncbi:MAG: LptF/LptG family permease [Planctomycetaceae bacterium]
MTTFDRHLLVRYLHAFVVYFVAALGLYVVVDGFTNLDEFQQAAAGEGPLGLVRHMAVHYLFQSSMLFELVGPTAAMMSASTVLALMSKNGELHPILAAGVPTYRLSYPVLGGLVLVNALLIANQELVIPRVTVFLQGNRGSASANAVEVEPCLSANGIYVTGARLFLGDNRLLNAEFRMSTGSLSETFVTLRAINAYYMPRKGTTPAGWVLVNPQPRHDQLQLTPEGRQVVFPLNYHNSIFIVSEVTPQELYNRGASFKYLSTSELLLRARQPSPGTGTARARLIHLHARMTRPLVMIVTLFLAFPMILRKESKSLVTNVAFCAMLMAMVFGTNQAMRFIGQAGLLSPELTVWLPIIGFSGLGAWLSPLTKT